MDVPTTQVQDADCRALFNNAEIDPALKQKNSSKFFSDKRLFQLAQNCQDFQQRRHYMSKPINDEESNFPLAFSILVYRDAGMAERLLRAIYRPQNTYCFHIDIKSPASVYDAIHAVAGCFSNVFMTPRRVDVHWGHFSVLEPELLCLEALWKYTAWKYFINLTGQEFPLKTNLELVKILKTFRGANDISGNPWHT